MLPSGRVIAGTVGGLYLTGDGGATWRHGGPDLTVLDLAWHPAKPERVVIATEGSGVWISEDGGSTLRRTAVSPGSPARAIVPSRPRDAAGDRFVKFDGGAGGIRTHDTLVTYTHFPGVRLRPLGHRSACLSARARR